GLGSQHESFLTGAEFEFHVAALCRLASQLVVSACELGSTLSHPFLEAALSFAQHPNHLIKVIAQCSPLVESPQINGGGHVSHRQILYCNGEDFERALHFAPVGKQRSSGKKQDGKENRGLQSGRAVKRESAQRESVHDWPA